MKDFLIFLPLTALYLIVKSTLFTYLPLPDVPLLIVFYLGYRRPSVEGAALAFAAGYLEDAFIGGIYGLTSSSLVFVFLASYLLSKKVQFITPQIKAGASFVLALLRWALVYTVLTAVEYDVPFLSRIVLDSALTGVMAPAVIPLLERLTGLLSPRGLKGKEM